MLLSSPHLFVQNTAICVNHDFVCSNEGICWGGGVSGAPRPVESDVKRKSIIGIMEYEKRNVHNIPQNMMRASE